MGCGAAGRVHHSGKCFLTRRLHSIFLWRKKVGMYDFHEPAQCVKQEKKTQHTLRKEIYLVTAAAVADRKDGFGGGVLGGLRGRGCSAPHCLRIPKAWGLSVLHILPSPPSSGVLTWLLYGLSPPTAGPPRAGSFTAAPQDPRAGHTVGLMSTC